MMRVTPLLQQQQDSSTAIRLIMNHIMASYSAMKVIPAYQFATAPYAAR
jgi:hypothetical protein